MNTLLEHFPKAARWSFVMFVVMIISVLFTLLGFFLEPGKIFSHLFTLAMGIWQIVLFRAYYKACTAAMDSGEAGDIERACEAQMKIIRLLGVLMLLTIVFGGLGLVAQLASRAGG
ncbi:hypothetical protein [uncultured Cardiobacterium sp.]|uniref:hypothetical protein n=1 Tax=uncultured Cardiobacterium sp. TaxID=417619 RepID=UPI00262D96CB|nr:hypothetical protein [uncultured Cardiobacterium sp.]